MNKQSGFTLIELVIVVVILGILAVTAIPKFLDLTDQAQSANVEGMAGGFATAISLVRSQWEAEGRPRSGTLNIVDYDGTRLLLTSESAASGAAGTAGAVGAIRPGYVVSSDTTATGKDDLSGLDANDCVDIWENIFQQPPIITSTITDLDTNPAIDYFADRSISGAVDTTLCHYYLTATLSQNATTGNFEAPNGATNIGNSFTYQPANSAVRIFINN